MLDLFQADLRHVLDSSPMREQRTDIIGRHRQNLGITRGGPGQRFEDENCRSFAQVQAVAILVLTLAVVQVERLAERALITAARWLGASIVLASGLLVGGLLGRLYRRRLGQRGLHWGGGRQRGRLVWHLSEMRLEPSENERTPARPTGENG